MRNFLVILPLCVPVASAVVQDDWRYERKLEAAAHPDDGKVEILAQKVVDRLQNETRVRREELGELKENEDESNSTCSSACIARQGDGFCDPMCDTMECLRDLGDCRSLPTSCSTEDCPSDGVCRWHCEVAGCATGACHFNDETMRAYLLVQLPNICPYDLYAKFEKLEFALHNMSGIHIRLVGDINGPLIWGLERETFAVRQLNFSTYKEYAVAEYGKLWRTTKALFEIAGHLLTYGSYRDRLIFDLMERLGRLQGHKTAILLSPIVLDEKQRAGYSAGFVAYQRGLQRWSRTKRRPAIDFSVKTTITCSPCRSDCPAGSYYY